MSSLPQPYDQLRAPRVHLDGVIPAVLRFADGQRTSGRLEVLSTHGGLLSLSNPLTKGSQVKVMFLTGAGSVLGGAEMLSPVNRSQQAFRFVSLAADDARRIHETVRASLPFQSDAELQWIEKFRAAAAGQQEKRDWLPKLFAGIAGLVMIGLAAGAMYFFR